MMSLKILTEALLIDIEVQNEKLSGKLVTKNVSTVVCHYLEMTGRLIIWFQLPLTVRLRLQME